MSERPLPVWVDTDMGLGTEASDVDDGFALAFLLAAQRSERLRVEHVSATYGNVPLEEAIPNTLSLLHVLGAESLEVLVGARRPLLQDIEPWRSRQAASRPKNPSAYRARTPRQSSVKGGSLELIRTLESRTEPIQVLTLGPLTDLASVLHLAPTASRRIERIVMMGGSAFAGGNVTAAAELNIWLDPEAAEMVFQSGIPVVMIGLDVTRKRPVYRDDLRAWAQAGTSSEAPTPLTYLKDGLDRWIGCRERMWGESWMYLHDAVAAAYLIRPDLFKVVEANVAIERAGTHTRGMTVVDVRTKGGAPPNALVCVDLDAEAVFELIVTTITQAFGHPAGQ